MENEPIPQNVFYGYSALHQEGNFYNDMGHGMGTPFYEKWKDRKDEFIQISELNKNGKQTPRT